MRNFGRGEGYSEIDGMNIGLGGAWKGQTGDGWVEVVKEKIAKICKEENGRK